MTIQTDRPIPDFLYGTAWKDERTATLTELAIRTGFRGIDTANQRRNYFEAGVGEGLAAAYRAGVVVRHDMFLQTKFTYQYGQDHRLPYDPTAPFPAQVSQSIASSLDHLGTDYIDSFVLHGPSSSSWTESDAEVWEAMRKERDSGRARLLGISNVSLQHLQEMSNVGTELPSLVQNRCYARLGWDRDMRQFCAQHKIIYQGFSLLTANQEVLQHAVIADLAKSNGGTPAQVIFSFARAIGILPLTGTTDGQHMKQDLESRAVKLLPEAVQSIERLAV